MLTNLSLVSFVSWAKPGKKPSACPGGRGLAKPPLRYNSCESVMSACPRFVKRPSADASRGYESEGPG